MGHAVSWAAPATLEGTRPAGIAARRASPGAGVRASPIDLQLGLHHVALIERTERAIRGGASVAVVRWPDDVVKLDELRRLGQPRLALVGAGDDPLPVSDDLEDWVRLPVEDRDALARLRHLRLRAQAHPARPLLDGAGRLIFAGRWVTVSHTEERLATPLVERFCEVVPYDDLIAAGWPQGTADRATLRPRMSGLRHRLGNLGLELLNVRGVGHVLQHPAP